MTEMLSKEQIDKISNELSTLYSKAKTKEEYENLMKLSRRYADKLQSHMVFPNAIVMIVFHGDWAEYHLFDKFPEGFTKEDINKFAKKIEANRLRLMVNETDDNRVALLYLEFNIWSHLLNNQEKANWCIVQMDRIISNGKVSEASILKMINSAGNKEMDAKNWTRAIEIFNGINKFPQEILEKPENRLYTANIFNQRGASKIRGDIDIRDGIKDIVIALDYYLKQTPVPMKHIEGIRNRLMEATKKL